MHVNTWWLVPLAVGAVGAAGLSVLAVRLDRQVGRLQKAMRPLRTGRPHRDEG